ncbi:MAG: hypothetical protein ACLR1A_07725 [Eubacterium ventriosum]
MEVCPNNAVKRLKAAKYIKEADYI